VFIRVAVERIGEQLSLALSGVRCLRTPDRNSRRRQLHHSANIFTRGTPLGVCRNLAAPCHERCNRKFTRARQDVFNFAQLQKEVCLHQRTSNHSLLLFLSLTSALHYQIS